MHGCSHTLTHTVCSSRSSTYTHMQHISMQAHTHTHTHTNALTINSTLHHQRQTLLHSQDTLCFSSLLICPLLSPGNTHTHSVHKHTHLMSGCKTQADQFPPRFLFLSLFTMAHSVTAAHFEVTMLSKAAWLVSESPFSVAKAAIAFCCVVT